MKRIYHPYSLWEEYTAGMWRKIPIAEEEEFLTKAIVFTGDHQLYGSYMLRIIELWPISCEHNLTNSGINRRAWIGHAACCLAFHCPEYIVRAAWGHLTSRQQIDANQQADIAIRTWELRRETSYA